MGTAHIAFIHCAVGKVDFWRKRGRRELQRFGNTRARRADAVGSQTKQETKKRWLET